jgi:hypothetical protein
VGLLNDGTMLPMAAVMVACAGAAWVLGLLAPGRREEDGTRLA